MNVRFWAGFAPWLLTGAFLLAAFVLAIATRNVVIDVIVGWVWLVFVVGALARWVWAPIYMLRLNSEWRYPLTDPKATGYDEFFPPRHSKE